MSLLNWLTPKPDDHSDSESAAHKNSANKVQRAAHREQLYPVIRESMVRAGILSSRYKFKVLSADSRGEKFLVMIDLAPDIMENTDQLGQIEALIVRHAAARLNFEVIGTYWRVNRDLPTMASTPAHRPGADHHRADGVLGATQYGELN